MSRAIQSQFSKTGYAIEKGVFTDAEIETLENEFDQIVTQLKKSGENINARWGSNLTRHIEDSDSEVIHTHNIQSYSSIMLNMVQNETLLDLAESLVGPDIILHHTKLFCKPPKKGSAFPLHQDWSYFPTQKNSMIAAVVHLSESTEDMGCFRVVPESHKLGEIKNSDGHSHVPEIHDFYSLETALPIEAEKGDVLFLHGNTIHGSYLNVSKTHSRPLYSCSYISKDEEFISGNTAQRKIIHLN